MNDFSDQDKKILLNQIIDKMVDEELIRQEADSLKIAVTSDEIQDAIELVALRQKKNAVQFKLSLIQNGVFFENYAKQIESELLWSKIISEVLRSKVKITESETKEFFEQQKFDINVKKLFIAEIFIPKDEDSSNHAAGISRKLVSELRNGADFRNIVKQFSRDSLSAENHGEIGWVSQKDIDKKIYEEVSKLKNGEYSDPILLTDGYYIFKLIESKVETKIEDQDLNVARNNIFMRKLQNLAKGYLMDLRKRAFVEIDRERIVGR
jgi:parvulin-like peptidyl-prolyl isomerase